MRPLSFSLSLPRRRRLSLGGGRTRIMGILNRTEDSFYGASRVHSEEACLARAEEMLAQGADILDIGAESTRPGSEPVPEALEKERLVPVIREIRRRHPEAVISVDTTKAAVGEACLEAGADMLNDISGLGFDSDLAAVAARWQAPLVLMHMKGIPRTMQENPEYPNLMEELSEYFEERLSLAESKGCPRSQVILDPGLGFGKKDCHNLRILREIARFRSFGLPLLMGYSRKSTIGRVLDLPRPEDRLEGTLALSAWCAAQGVEILRVHDVRENLRAVRMIQAVMES
ncbi:MAG TPA: dihydropteroate synthase [Synergistaceae bacterium]|nr:dihydropteroate synthase [Synergistaceae bacterium]HPJ26489.1 dihydropteroate synthase [Synergistaceae bacterium]HPQ38318.1 dihydropteroate synthase [Synergistaceae bacterium]